MGFGVAVWIQKAIPEPQNAEQQQCRSRFYIYILREHCLAGPAFLFVSLTSNQTTNYMSINEILQNLSQWDLPLESSVSEKAMLCAIKGDIAGYLMANGSCSLDEQTAAQQIRFCANTEYSALRKYAEEHNEEFALRHLSYLKQYNRKTMAHRYSSSQYWQSIERYIDSVESTRTPSRRWMGE